MLNDDTEICDSVVQSIDEDGSNVTVKQFLACRNCFSEFAWKPIARDRKFYCCVGCRDGGPCICSYEQPELSPELRFKIPEYSNSDEHGLKQQSSSRLKLLVCESSVETLLVAENLTDTQGYLLLLDQLPTADWVRLIVEESRRSIFAIGSANVADLLNDLIRLPNPYKSEKVVTTSLIS